MTAHSSRLSILVCLIALLAAGSAAHADYVAYAVTKDGDVPLPQELDGINHKHLVRFKWGQYEGPKVRVAVLEVDNNSQTSSYTVTGPGGQVYSYEGVNFNETVPVNGIEAMVTDALQQSGRFRMVERVVVGDVMAEQDLASSGRVSKPSGAETGKILGAQYLMQAVVTSYEPNFKGKKGGLGGITKGLLGGVKGGKSKSMVGMNFRLIDAETSEILFTKQIDAIVSSTELSLGGIGWGGGGALGGFMSSYSKTPIGQAVMAAVNHGVYELIKQVGAQPLAGSVVKAGEDGVYINLGASVMQPGMTLQAVAKGEELIDPETGLSLGGEEQVVGTLRVDTVKEKYCIAQPVGFDASSLAQGDKVVSTAKPAVLEFASSWAGPGKKKK